MFWSLTFKMMPDETIIEDSTKDAVSGLKPTYAVILTTKRIVFRFEAIGSSMTQSFTYQEISDARPVKRLMINYLHLQTPAKEYFLHTPNPEYWSAKIISLGKNLPSASGNSAPYERSASRKRQELGDMLDVLQHHKLLTTAEVEEKKKMLETLQL
jgi:hypothetical protein